ncbi:MAG: translation initiation factor IF-2 N-terminal domain-containing protein, partial [Firmicutes bacterium]|nr:translation initiation factor IF-2 N-terminal domain-containing protein [Bacillota bacterium]
MVKKRVHEVAKELDLQTKDLMRQLDRMGIEAKSHMSTLDDADIVRLTNHYQGQKAKTAPAASQADGSRDNDRRLAPGTSEAADSGKQRPPRHGRDKRGGQKHYDHGPGLVDRVPSRPPDRRFTEKPMRFNNGKAAAPKASNVDSQAVAAGRPQTANEQLPQTPVENQPAPQETQSAASGTEKNVGERVEHSDNRPRPAERSANARTGAVAERQQRPQFDQTRR